MCCCMFQDMSSVSTYDAGVALSGLACFITSDLARDLANDIMTLVSDVAYNLYTVVNFSLKKGRFL